MGLVQAKGILNSVAVMSPIAAHCLNFVTLMNFMLIDVSSLFILQLGANAILAVSLAVCKAGALVKKIPLYQVYLVLEIVINFPVNFSRMLICSLILLF